MWQVVYVAPDQAQGQRVKDLLNQQGFLVMVRPAGGGQPGAGTPYEVLVPSVEAEEAQETITKLLAARQAGRRG